MLPTFLRIVLIFIGGLFLFSCEREYNGEISMSGYCYDTCSGSPLVHYRVSYRNSEIQIQTYTDSTGYFSLEGKYTVTYNTQKPYEEDFVDFIDTTESSVCCDYFVIPEGLKIEDDTIYGYNTVNSILQIRMNSIQTTTNEDTLFIDMRNFRDYNGNYLPSYRSNTLTYSIDYTHYFVGPFSDAQILDTLETLASPHAGGLFYYPFGYNFRGPNVGAVNGLGEYSFVPGQRNISCNTYQTIEINLSN